MGQSIVLGISGGIAAYKTVELVRRLREQDDSVEIIMTQAAQSFVTPLTFQAISGNPVHCDLLDAHSEAAMDHISLARLADQIIIAPASADLIARLAQGMANDLLTAVCLASTAPLALVPAMNHRMWKHPQTQANIEHLKNRGVAIWGPETGPQACGEYGPGRMLEPSEILRRINEHRLKKSLQGKTLVITAGPTREPIDPVRFISNRSSGKMGYALAEAAKALGAQVILISGPVCLTPPSDVQLISVETALEMQAAVLSVLPHCQIFIGCAAVSDLRPQTVNTQKYSKDKIPAALSWVANPDILASVVQFKPKPLVVGFAAQTHDVKLYAQKKLADKHLDLIIANEVGLKDSGFDSDFNAVDIYSAHHDIVHFSRQLKRELAYALLNWINDYDERHDKN